MQDLTRKSFRSANIRSAARTHFIQNESMTNVAVAKVRIAGSFQMYNYLER